MFGISQSGGSPDLIQSLEVARAQGALTVAVTNNAGSELAQVAEVHVDILAGTERAVAATNSCTAQLLAMYLFLDRVFGGSRAVADALPDLAASFCDASPTSPHRPSASGSPNALSPRRAGTRTRPPGRRRSS
jgi:glucosamine--fructose-6-phosphate aminotransferase (isomerizing)